MAEGPGYLERLDLSRGVSSLDVRLAEAPLSTAQTAPVPEGLTGVASLGFTNTLAIQQWARTILVLSVSGITSVPLDYDVPVTAPTIESVVNAANGRPGVAPGGLVRILGKGLSLESQSASGAPWPAVLGNACVTVNAIPLPLSRVSPTEMVAQLPFTALGTGALAVRSTAGISNLFNLTISPTAPAVFLTRNTDVGVEVASVVRSSNGQMVTFANPIRGEDEIEIYFTGGGIVSGGLQPGAAAPAEPPARTLAPAAVTLGGESCPVTFSGMAPGQVGVYKVTASVPWWIKSGSEVALTLSQGSAETSVGVRVLGK